MCFDLHVCASIKDAIWSQMQWRLLTRRSSRHSAGSSPRSSRMRRRCIAATPATPASSGCVHARGAMLRWRKPSHCSDTAPKMSLRCTWFSVLDASPDQSRSISAPLCVSNFVLANKVRYIQLPYDMRHHCNEVSKRKKGRVVVRTN